MNNGELICRKPYSKWTMFSTNNVDMDKSYTIKVVNLILNGLCSLL